MLIGLLSDTHVNSPAEKLPVALGKAFTGVDLILHAGDIWIPEVLDRLEKQAPVLAAWGDDDREQELGGDPRMLAERSLNLDGYRVWLTHELPHRVKHRSRFDDVPEALPDVIVFGHSHRHSVEQHGGTLLVNPGSATWPRYRPGPGTVALLKLEPSGASAEVLDLGRI